MVAIKEAIANILSTGNKIEYLDIPAIHIGSKIKSSKTAMKCLECANSDLEYDLTIDRLTIIEIIMIINKYRSSEANYLSLSRETGLRIAFCSGREESASISLFDEDSFSIMNTMTEYRDKVFEGYIGEQVSSIDVLNWCKVNNLYDIAISEIV